VHVDQYEYLVEFSFSPTRLEIDTSAMALNRLLSTEGKSKTSPSTVLRTLVLTKSPDMGFVDVTSRSRHCHNSTPCWSSWRIWSSEWTTGSSFESWFDCLAFSTPCPTSNMVLNHPYPASKESSLSQRLPSYFYRRRGSIPLAKKAENTRGETKPFK